MGNDNLYKRFYDELEKEHNITRDQFIEYDFKFCGKFKPPKEEDVYDEDRIPKVGEQLFPYRCLDFKEHPLKYIDKITFMLISHRFIFKRECICKHDIICNCFIYSK